MATIEHLQTNFTGGEISPTVYGRVDLQKYANCLKRAENIQIRVQGGATQREGLRYKATASATARRLVPFIATVADSYILAFEPSAFKVYKNGALQVTVTAPWDAVDIDKFTFTQSNDVMVVAVETKPPYQIKRLSDTNWTCSQFGFSFAPQKENGFGPTGVTYTLSALTGSITITASSAVFLAADVGRDVTAGTGFGEITAIGGGGTTASVTTSVAFNSLSYNAMIEPVLTMLDSPVTSIAITPSGTPKVGDTITLTAPIDAFRSSNVGSYVYANGGIAKITSFTSAKIVAAVVESALSSDATVYAGGWSIRTPAWGNVYVLGGYDYPGAVVFHDGRLIFGGSTNSPQTIWASRVQVYNDFSTGSDPDDGFDRELTSDRRDQIRHLVSSRSLLCMTYGTEYSIYGGNDGPLTPLTVTAKPQSTYGAAACLPEVVGNEVLFVQRAGKRIRAAAYSLDSDQYIAPDITELHDRITMEGVKELVYAQEPYQNVWAVLDDGTACSFTYSQQQAVTGFVRHTFPGDVISMASVPGSGRDDVYVLLERGANRFLCVMEEGLCLDLAGTVTGSAITSGTFAWLANETVKPLLDDCPDVEITANGSGVVTFPYAVNSATVGLSFTPLIETLPIELQMADGSAQGRMASISEVMLRLLETQGLYVNGYAQSFRTTANTPTLNLPSPSFTGDHFIQVLGAQRNGKQVIIEQRQPLPFHILCLRRTLTV